MAGGGGRGGVRRRRWWWLAAFAGCGFGLRGEKRKRERGCVAAAVLFLLFIYLFYFIFGSCFFFPSTPLVGARRGEGSSGWVGLLLGAAAFTFFSPFFLCVFF